MFNSRLDNASCKTCRYWKKAYEGVEDYYDDFGECRRFPPSTATSEVIVTREQRNLEEEYNLKVQKAYESWLEMHEKQLDAELKRRDQIEESIRTAKHPDSIKHWEKKLIEWQAGYDKISSDKFSLKGKYIYVPQYDPEKGPGENVQLGRWMLTCGNEYCGEWKSS